MKMNYKHYFTLVLFVLCLFIQVECKNDVVLVVIDGLKNDYLKTLSSSSSHSDLTVKLPNLHGLIDEGIYVENITPEFPASRLPFLTSMLTGVHAQEHGILGNEIYDEKSGKVWQVEKDADLFWEKAVQLENIWVRYQTFYLSYIFIDVSDFRCN